MVRLVPLNCGYEGLKRFEGGRGDYIIFMRVTKQEDGKPAEPIPLFKATPDTTVKVGKSVYPAF